MGIRRMTIKFQDLMINEFSGQAKNVSAENNLIKFEQVPESPPSTVILQKNKVKTKQISAGLKTTHTNDPEVQLTWNETKKGYEIPIKVQGFEMVKENDVNGNSKTVKKLTPVNLKWYFIDNRKKKTDTVDITYYINDNGKKIGDLTIKLNRRPPTSADTV